ncbi:MAG: M14 family zinc carboxypeptidase, partial [bacterium]
MKRVSALNRKGTYLTIIAITLFLFEIKISKNPAQQSARHSPNNKLRTGGKKRPSQLNLKLAMGVVNARHLPGTSSVPAHFPDLDSMYSWIRRLQKQYPHLLQVETIGKSSSMHLPLYALKVSDNASNEEDESSVLFSALHHAREPIGGLLSMQIVEMLLSSYEQNKTIRKLVNSLEVWIVPIVNPEGYRYVFDNRLNFPWWRKNLHDNDNDGIFNPVIDGVDLNRNYDYNWMQGGEDNPASWFYRGKEPFSENEITAMRSLALRENIVAGLSFHSYGEVVLYPWGNYYAAPDQDLIYTTGQKLASHIRKLSNTSTYGLLPLNGRVGQSSVWMYGRLRAIDFIVELGDEYFTNGQDTRQVIREALAGVEFFLNRALISNIQGHIFDANTKQPLVAKILVEGYEAQHVSPRYSEPLYGRFERWLSPGIYNIEISTAGYARKLLSGVEVKEDSATKLEIFLKKQ